jgi:hypothetical protein
MKSVRRIEPWDREGCAMDRCRYHRRDFQSHSMWHHADTRYPVESTNVNLRMEDLVERLRLVEKAGSGDHEHRGVSPR